MINRQEMQDLLSGEQRALRGELQSLKGCQITFLSISVTTTGLLIGIAPRLATGDRSAVTPLIFLAPLAIILPSWWIFFDKAQTITRIVGYYRWLEKLRYGYGRAQRFWGWECALEQFRREQEEYDGGNRKGSPFEGLPEPTRLWSQLQRFVTLKTPHKYWVIAYTIFSSLTGLTLVTAWVSGRPNGFLESLAWAACVAAVLFALLYNFGSMRQLIDGRYSYRANETVWGRILHATVGP